MPAQEWIEVGYNDKDWNTGLGAFGKVSPKEKVGTKWVTSDIWLRTTFRLATIPKTLRVTLRHDEDVEVYLNGTLVFQNTDLISKYETHDISLESADVLQTGKNVMAVHCSNTIGGQFIDLGLECFEEAVDHAELIRKHANRLMGEDLYKQYKNRMRELGGIYLQSKSDYYKALSVAEEGEQVTEILRRGNPALEGSFPSLPRSANPPEPVYKSCLNRPGEEPPWLSGLDPKIILYLPG